MSVSYTDDKLVRGSEIRELYEEAGWTILAARTPDDVEASVRSSDLFLTAREGAKLAGFIAALSDRCYYAHITEFLVRPRYQATGVGAELLRRLLEALATESVVTIFAEPDAEAFYRKSGFAPTAGGMILRR